MVSSEQGQVTPYALHGLYDRGIFFVEPGEQVYAGQVIGEHCKDNDIVANPIKSKQLTAVRTRGGKDDNMQIRPARKMSLEQCLEYIGPRRVRRGHAREHPVEEEDPRRGPPPPRGPQAGRHDELRRAVRVPATVPRSFSSLLLPTPPQPRTVGFRPAFPPRSAASGAKELQLLVLPEDAGGSDKELKLLGTPIRA